MVPSAVDCVSALHHTFGEVTEWPNVQHWKCCVPFTRDPGFESLPLRQYPKRRPIPGRRFSLAEQRDEKPARVRAPNAERHGLTDQWACQQRSEASGNPCLSANRYSPPHGGLFLWWSKGMRSGLPRCGRGYSMWEEPLCSDCPCLLPPQNVGGAAVLRSLFTG